MNSTTTNQQPMNSNGSFLPYDFELFKIFVEGMKRTRRRKRRKRRMRRRPAREFLIRNPDLIHKPKNERSERMKEFEAKFFDAYEKLMSLPLDRLREFLGYKYQLTEDMREDIIILYLKFEHCLKRKVLEEWMHTYLTNDRFFGIGEDFLGEYFRFVQVFLCPAGCEQVVVSQRMLKYMREKQKSFDDLLGRLRKFSWDPACVRHYHLVENGIVVADLDLYDESYRWDEDNGCCNGRMKKNSVSVKK